MSSPDPPPQRGCPSSVVGLVGCSPRRRRRPPARQTTTVTSAAVAPPSFLLVVVALLALGGPGGVVPGGRGGILAAASDVVVANNEQCTAIGRQLIQRRATVEQVYVAVSICEGVVHPMDSGLGGGFQGLLYNGDGRSRYILARERSPYDAAFARRPLWLGNSIGVPAVMSGYALLLGLKRCLRHDAHKEHLGQDLDTSVRATGRDSGRRRGSTTTRGGAGGDGGGSAPVSSPSSSSPSSKRTVTKGGGGGKAGGNRAAATEANGSGGGAVGATRSRRHTYTEAVEQEQLLRYVYDQRCVYDVRGGVRASPMANAPRGVPYRDLFEPSVRLARYGFNVSRTFADIYGHLPTLQQHVQLLANGTVARNPVLADFLQYLSENPLRLLDPYVRWADKQFDHHNNLRQIMLSDVRRFNSTLTSRDFQLYQALAQPSLVASFRLRGVRYMIHSMPSPAGGETVVFFAKMIEAVNDILSYLRRRHLAEPHEDQMAALFVVLQRYAYAIKPYFRQLSDSTKRNLLLRDSRIIVRRSFNAVVNCGTPEELVDLLRTEIPQIPTLFGLTRVNTIRVLQPNLLNSGVSRDATAAASHGGRGRGDQAPPTSGDEDEHALEEAYETDLELGDATDDDGGGGGPAAEDAGAATEEPATDRRPGSHDDHRVPLDGNDGTLYGDEEDGGDNGGRLLNMYDSEVATTGGGTTMADGTTNGGTSTTTKGTAADEHWVSGDSLAPVRAFSSSSSVAATAAAGGRRAPRPTLPPLDQLGEEETANGGGLSSDHHREIMANLNRSNAAAGSADEYTRQHYGAATANDEVDGDDNNPWGTSNIVVKRGNRSIVATSSINHSFGSGIYSARLGFPYNNVLRDFTPKTWYQVKGLHPHDEEQQHDGRSKSGKSGADDGQRRRRHRRAGRAEAKGVSSGGDDDHDDKKQRSASGKAPSSSSPSSDSHPSSAAAAATRSTATKPGLRQPATHGKSSSRAAGRSASSSSSKRVRFVKFANRALPHSVPQSSMGCTLITNPLTRNPVFAIGAAGGFKITGAIMNVMWNYFVLGQDLQTSISRMRLITKLNYKTRLTEIWYEIPHTSRYYQAVSSVPYGTQPPDVGRFEDLGFREAATAASASAAAESREHSGRGAASAYGRVAMSPRLFYAHRKRLNVAFIREAGYSAVTMYSTLHGRVEGAADPRRGGSAYIRH